MNMFGKGIMASRPKSSSNWYKKILKDKGIVPEDINIKLQYDNERLKTSGKEKPALISTTPIEDINDLNVNIIKDFLYNFEPILKTKGSYSDEMREFNDFFTYSLLHRNPIITFHVIVKINTSLLNNGFLIDRTNEIRIIFKEPNLISSNNGSLKEFLLEELIRQTFQFHVTLKKEERYGWRVFCSESQKTMGPITQGTVLKIDSKNFLDNQIELDYKGNFKHTIQPNNRTNLFLAKVLSRIWNLKEKFFSETFIKKMAELSPVINQFVNEANISYLDRDYENVIKELMWIPGDKTRHPMFRIEIKDGIYFLKNKDSHQIHKIKI